jgi:hypothetical protein
MFGHRRSEPVALDVKGGARRQESELEPWRIRSHREVVALWPPETCDGDRSVSASPLPCSATLVKAPRASHATSSNPPRDTLESFVRCQHAGVATKRPRREQAVRRVQRGPQGQRCAHVAVVRRAGFARA